MIVRPDINVYQHKKTLAQGMMDLALLSANANQLRYVIEARDYHPYYLFSITFIVASLVFQVLVGVGLYMTSSNMMIFAKQIKSIISSLLRYYSSQSSTFLFLHLEWRNWDR